jgi:hypothetical protein
VLKSFVTARFDRIVRRDRTEQLQRFSLGDSRAVPNFTQGTRIEL